MMNRMGKDDLDQGLREAMQANEKIVALFAKADGARADATEAAPGQRVVELACEPRHLVGVATGMGVYGMYPVVHLEQEDLLSGAFLQLLNSSSQFRYRSGGQYSAPMAAVVRYQQHLSLEPLLLQVPGLRVLVPSNFYDYANLLEQAAVDPDPCVIFVPAEWPEIEPEQQALWERKLSPKSAMVLREGSDITLVAYGALAQLGWDAAKILGTEGKSVELIDLRSLSPMDRETVLASVRKTGRLVILQDSPKSFGIGAELAASIVESALDSLLAPVKRVAAFDTPEPGALEHVVHPDRERLLHALRNLADF